MIAGGNHSLTIRWPSAARTDEECGQKQPCHSETPKGSWESPGIMPVLLPKYGEWERLYQEIAASLALLAMTGLSKYYGAQEAVYCFLRIDFLQNLFYYVG